MPSSSHEFVTGKVPGVIGGSPNPFMEMAGVELQTTDAGEAPTFEQSVEAVDAGQPDQVPPTPKPAYKRPHVFTTSYREKHGD